MTHESTAVQLASSSSNATASGGWWRDAVIYQVYVRSFADSDGDGVGDLRGVRSRLPHLARLGVDAVWLTPFYVSPQADGGYDVADYRAVDPLFGDLSDADELVRAAHALGLRVIVDVVPNHTSAQHPWFRAALAGDPAARARYLFRPGRGADGSEPPNDWESIFGGPAWTRVAAPAGEGGTSRPEAGGEWYLHLFAPEQPDLDWGHPEVAAEFASVLRFWLDLGVDGFRVDVAHGMVKAPGLPDIGRGAQATLIGTEPLPFFDQDGVHEIHRGWRRLLDSYEGDRIGVAEAWAPTSERLALYVRPDELHQAFNFRFLNCPWDPAAMRTVIDESLAATTSVGAPTTWVLSNHDVVRHVTRYGGGARGLARARAAALLMLALPGSAYLYQGEELGLPEVLDLPDESRRDPAFRRGRRHQLPEAPAEPAAELQPAGPQAGPEADGQEGLRDGCRVPIPWCGSEPPYGFGPTGSWLPQPAGWGGLTVAAQTGDPHSTLELYRAALELRRAMPGLGAPEAGTGPAAEAPYRSGMRWLPAPEGVLLFTRPGFACTLNGRPDPVELPAPGRPVLSSAPVETDGRTVRLPPGFVHVVVIVNVRPVQSNPVTARLADIAAQAGVSEATVSRVLNGKPGVAAGTRESVLAALDVLGYERPVKLRQRSAGLVGLITPELDNPIFPALAQVIGQALTRQGYTPVLATQTPGGSTEDELTEMLVDRGVSGIIFVSGLHADTTADMGRYDQLRGQGVPYVLINGFSDKVQAPFVSPDDRAAMHLAVTHLTALGHTRIGLAVGPKRFVPVLRKIEGFRLGMKERLGLGEAEIEELIQHSLYSLEGGQAAAAALISRGCTAVVCASDMMALGAIRAARQQGLRVPQDVSVVGFDDSPLIAFTDPPLTTIRQPVQAMGQAAVRTLLEEIGGTPAPHSEFVFLPELVVRGSTASGPGQRRAASRT